MPSRMISEDTAYPDQPEQPEKPQPLAGRLDLLVKCLRKVFVEDHMDNMVALLILVAAAFCITLAVGNIINWGN